MRGVGLETEGREVADQNGGEDEERERSERSNKEAKELCKQNKPMPTGLLEDIFSGFKL